jgi:hypothetical protein
MENKSMESTIDTIKFDKMISNLDELIKNESLKVELLKKYKIALIQKLYPITWRSHINKS